MSFAVITTSKTNSAMEINKPILPVISPAIVNARPCPLNWDKALSARIPAIMQTNQRLAAHKCLAEKALIVKASPRQDWRLPANFFSVY